MGFLVSVYNSSGLILNFFDCEARFTSNDATLDVYITLSKKHDFSIHSKLSNKLGLLVKTFSALHWCQ